MRAILALCFGRLVMSLWSSASRSATMTSRSSWLGWRMEAER